MGDQLVCVHRGRDGDENLYWATNDGTGWTADTRFSNGNRSQSGPALCVFNGVLYCVHRGETGDTGIWWSTFDPGSRTWSQDRQFSNGNQTNSGPALCVLQGVLYCVHKGNDDDYLWYSTFDPGSGEWAEDRPFSNNNRTSCQPALFNINDQAMYCVHKGAEDNNLWWCQFTGDDWTGDNQFSQGNQTCSAPAVTNFQGTAYCVHRGGDDENLWWCQWNGNGWSADTQVQSASSWTPPYTQTTYQLFPTPAISAAGPGLAVFNGSLVCVHELGLTRWSDADPNAEGGANSQINAGMGGSIAAASFIPVVGWVIGGAVVGSALAEVDSKLAVVIAPSLPGAWSIDALFGQDNHTGDTPALTVFNFP